MGSCGHRPPWNLYRFPVETYSFHAERIMQKSSEKDVLELLSLKIFFASNHVGCSDQEAGKSSFFFTFTLFYKSSFFFTFTLFYSMFGGLAFLWIFSMVASALSIAKMEIRVQKIQMHIPCNIFLIWTPQ